MKMKSVVLAALFAPLAVAADHPPVDEIAPAVDGRIVGGEPAVTAQWGFFTQLVKRGRNFPFCGASYLGDGYVLTAAHCVDGKRALQLAVKIGGYHHQGQDGERVDVAKIFSHPDYNPVTFANDIAVLKLTRTPHSRETVEVAEGSLAQYVRPGDMLQVAGLGRTSWTGPSPGKLHQVSVPLVAPDKCKAVGGGYAEIGTDAFCAGYDRGQKDACKGDSGGPIVVRRGGSVTQLGIVSWGSGCAQPERYGVYSNIADLRGWLDQVTGRNGTVTSPHYAIDYPGQQSLGRFALGELKQHTFTIRNSGQQPFTLTALDVLATGTAIDAVLAEDSCSHALLAGGEQCQATVEFAARAIGSAGVALQFSTDQVTTRYTARASAKVVRASEAGTPEQAYEYIYPQGIGSYTAGTKVLAENGAVYQCKGYPQSLWCAQGATYAPGTWAGKQAWNRL